MNRLTFAVLIALALGLTLALLLRVDTNPGSVFGESGAPVTALETDAGRQGAILIRGGDDASRHNFAKMALELLQHPAIQSVSAGPQTGDPNTLGWLWQHRFRLEPPSPADLTPEQMSMRLSEAVDALTRSDSMVLGDRLLRDPTGSFQRLIQRLEALRPDLNAADGFWQGNDGGTLLFLTFSERPLDARELGQLTTTLRTKASDAGVNIHLAGPRFISTEVSAATERGATLAGTIATVLLLIWLVYALRDWRGFASVLLPLALGHGTAALAVQMIFGSVHVIALGFGGALAGLALDYPLHLAGHGKDGSLRARRLIGIGVTTTVAAFLAMTGAGLAVLTQTGLFVAIGLSVAAIFSVMLATEPRSTRTPPVERLFWNLPGRLVTLAIFCAMGGMMVWLTKPMIDRPLFDLPEQVQSDLDTVRKAVSMPATRHLLQVSGSSAEQVLSRETTLLPVLEQAVKAGEIGGYRMARSLLPPTSAQQAEMPSPETLRPDFEQALASAGLQAGYAQTLIDTYAEALQANIVRPEELQAHTEFANLLTGLTTENGVTTDTVTLLPPLDAAALTARLRDTALPGVTFEDLAENIWASVAELRATAANWLGIGAAFAALVLAVMLRQTTTLIRVVLTVGASLALTAALLTALLGSLTVFQIVALTLVVGIGVDYALFLDPTIPRQQQVLAARSVSLCAGSTLLAFVTMACSDVRVMGEIGLTVSLGVLVVIVLSLGMMGRQFRPKPAENKP